MNGGNVMKYKKEVHKSKFLNKPISKYVYIDRMLTIQYNA